MFNKSSADGRLIRKKSGTAPRAALVIYVNAAEVGEPGPVIIVFSRMWRHAPTIQQPKQAVHALSADYLFDRTPRGPCPPCLRPGLQRFDPGFVQHDSPPFRFHHFLHWILFYFFFFQKDLRDFLVTLYILCPIYKPSNDKKNIRKISRHEKEKPPPLLHTPSSTATRITNFRVLARSRVSYARQIAVMTVHRGKKCHVRGKQNVSRAYVPPSPPLTSSPLLAHGSEVPLIRRVFSDPLPLPFVYIYARFSCCFCGRQETRETNVEGTDVEKKRLCPDGSGSSIDEKYHRAISGETTEAMIDVF